MPFLAGDLRRAAAPSKARGAGRDAKPWTLSQSAPAFPHRKCRLFAPTPADRRRSGSRRRGSPAEGFASRPAALPRTALPAGRIAFASLRASAIGDDLCVQCRLAGEVRSVRVLEGGATRNASRNGDTRKSRENQTDGRFGQPGFSKMEHCFHLNWVSLSGRRPAFELRTVAGAHIAGEDCVDMEPAPAHGRTGAGHLRGRAFVWRPCGDPATATAIDGARTPRTTPPGCRDPVRSRLRIP